MATCEYKLPSSTAPPPPPRQRLVAKHSTTPFAYARTAPPLPRYDTYYSLQVDGLKPGQALNELGLKRYCCRRMILTHVDLIDKLLAYNTFQKRVDEGARK